MIICESGIKLEKKDHPYRGLGLLITGESKKLITKDKDFSYFFVPIEDIKKALEE